MFTAVTLNNTVLGDSSKPVVLNITPSYPAPAYYPTEKARHVPHSWVSQDRPTVEGNLELTLLHKISEGRIGVVYLARVDRAVHDGIDTTSSLPEILCLKFAKRHHCRSLAREAWFYEQLNQWHGVSIPKYFGFFTSTVHEHGLNAEQFQPWTDLRTPSKIDPALIEDPELAKTYRSMDWLWDDAPYMFSLFSRSNYRKESQWFKWNLDEENPNIGVIVMENLGQACTEVWLPNEPGDAFKTDLQAVLEDVAQIGVFHADVSARNFVEYNGPETDDRRCPRHGVVHKWRLIDFDRSCKADLTNIKGNRDYLISVDRDSVGHELVFWGSWQPDKGW